MLSWLGPSSSSMTTRASGRVRVHCSRLKVSTSSAKPPTGLQRSNRCGVCARRWSSLMCSCRVWTGSGWPSGLRRSGPPRPSSSSSSRGRGAFRSRLAASTARGFITKAEFSGRLERRAHVTLLQVAGDLSAGLALLSAGTVAWIRARDSRTGPLLVLAGASWLAGDVAGLLIYAHRGPLVHALLTFPTGCTRSKPTLVVIVLAYIDGLVPTVAREPWTTVALMVAVVCAAASRWAGSHGADRRDRGVAVACAAAVAAPLLLALIGRLTGSETDDLATALYDAAMVFTAVALAVGVASRPLGALGDHRARRGSRRQSGATGPAGRALRAVGDPRSRDSLPGGPGLGRRVGAAGGAPVSGAGRADASSPSSRTAGRSLRRVLHDPTALRDATLAQSVIAAVRIGPGERAAPSRRRHSHARGGGITSPARRGR